MTRYLCLLFWSAMLAGAQTLGSLHGVVKDTTDAVIPGVTVTLTGPGGQRRITSGAMGDYSFSSLANGKYTLRLTNPGFAPVEKSGIDVSGADVTLDVTMLVTLEKQTVNVEDENRTGVSVDPTQNAGQLVLKGADLDALSDDPDQLSQDLQALAGPAAGPNGGQIFIDGFSGGQLPPKSSIREVRINSNPFAAEYDRMGFGRIEILTKPGTDRFRGGAFFNFSDKVFNSRNPFSPTRPPYQSRLFGFNLSGPITKKSSFSFDGERRDIDENSIINATVLSNDLIPQSLQQAIVTPQQRTHLTPRVDFALSQKHTLTARYSWSKVNEDNQGVGQFSLASRAYNQGDSDHTVQLTETAILSPTLINEARFQFRRSSVFSNADNTIPTIQVLDAFTGGGAQIGLSGSDTNSYEMTNITSWSHKTHTVKFGARIRGNTLADTSPQNFGGTYTFTGGLGPELDANNQALPGPLVQLTSLERYRRTLLFQQLGYSPALIRTLGGGASQFSLAAGNALASVNQVDAGIFAQDDWRLKPNFTISYGFRYEMQTNISDRSNISPRLSFAWGVPRKGGAPKTVVRGGFGIFYDRFADTLTLQTLRFNGTDQRQYLVPNPDFYPRIPTEAELATSQAPQAVRTLYSGLRTPAMAQLAIGVDRQLPWRTSVSISFIHTHGSHMLRTLNINAPQPDGTRPLGTTENVYMYDSSGRLNQNQMIVNFNSRASSRLSLFGFYSLQKAKSDTDGVQTFPANPYNWTSEYSAAQFDIRHRIFLGGMITSPGKLAWSPFIVASSGMPFNITTGRDNNGDSIFNDRPSFAAPGTPGAIVTQFGTFNPNPKPGEELIPRNYGRGPAQFSVNLRLSRTWGFGERSTGSASQPDGPPPGMGGIRGGGPGGPGGGGPRGGPGGPMGMGGGGRGPGGPGGIFGGVATGKRFNLTLSISARNLLNHVNLAAPNGNLTSPLFGQSLSTTGGFASPGANASAAGNRRLELSLRFTF